jgi:hypothetical protein
VTCLPPSKIDAAKRARAILALLAMRLRRVWAKVRIILRADSGVGRYLLRRNIAHGHSERPG